MCVEIYFRGPGSCYNAGQASSPSCCPLLIVLHHKIRIIDCVAKRGGGVGGTAARGATHASLDVHCSGGAHHSPWARVFRHNSAVVYIILDPAEDITVDAY